MHHTTGQVLLPIMLSPLVPQTEIHVGPLAYPTEPVRLTSYPSGHENLNKWFQSGDQAYIIVSSAMVLLMVPGLGFLYSGLARRKSALSMMWACMGAGSVITFQWYFWGYSLAFSPTGQNGFIGDPKRFGLMNTLVNPSPGSPLIPSLLYAFYQV
jgi:Amt family ammonium transporter